MLNANQMNYSPKSSSSLTFVVYVISVLAFVAVALLLFSPSAPTDSFWHRGDLFWFRLIWFQALFAVAWFGAFLIPVRNLLNHRQQVGGGFTAMSAAVLNAVLLSMIVLLVSLFLPRERIFTITPFVFQILIAVVCLIKVMLLRQAQCYQNDGLAPIPLTLKSPDELVAFLELCERQPDLKTETAKQVKRIREKIKYSVPRAGKVASSPRYRETVLLVDSIYQQFMSGSRDRIPVDLRTLENTVSLLVSECKQ